jgi:hypothetical protein
MIHGPKPPVMNNGTKPPVMIHGTKPRVMIHGQEPAVRIHGTKPPVLIRSPEPPASFPSPGPAEIVNHTRVGYCFKSYYNNWITLGVPVSNNLLPSLAYFTPKFLYFSEIYSHNNLLWMNDERSAKAINSALITARRQLKKLERTYGKAL